MKEQKEKFEFNYDSILTEEKIKKMIHVLFTPFAYIFCAKMCMLHGLEVGWNLLTRFIDDKMILSLPFYPKNKDVSSGACDTSIDGEMDMARFMIKKGIRKLKIPYKCWCHSHVNMGVSASSKDNQTIKDLTIKNNWYYRLIENVNKDINLMLFFKGKDGIIYSIKCTYEISPWSWDVEQNSYPDIKISSDIEEYILQLKKDYNYDKYTTVKPPIKYNTTDIYNRNGILNNSYYSDDYYSDVYKFNIKDKNKVMSNNNYFDLENTIERNDFLNEYEEDFDESMLIDNNFIELNEDEEDYIDNENVFVNNNLVGFDENGEIK